MFGKDITVGNEYKFTNTLNPKFMLFGLLNRYNALQMPSF